MIPSASFPPAVEDNTIFISAEPLDIVGLLSKAHHPGAGAVVLFSGEVRNDNNNKQVAFLEYEAQAAIASRMINDILQEASNKWELNIAIAQHRIGKVNICESAVLVITASPHRKEAYDANRFIIDKIKHEVPIWKREYFTDGTNKWGGNCNCNAITGDTNKHIYDY